MQIYPSRAPADLTAAQGNSPHESQTHPAPATAGAVKFVLGGLERPGWLERLLQFPDLESLDLRQYGIGPQTDLLGLSRLKNLRRLGLPFQTTDQHLYQLRHVVGLESVCLARCVEITPVGIAHLARLPRLNGMRLPIGMPQYEIRQLEEEFILFPPDPIGFRRCLGVKLIRRQTSIRDGYTWEPTPLNGCNPANPGPRRSGCE